MNTVYKRMINDKKVPKRVDCKMDVPTLIEFKDQFSLLLQYEILEKLMTFKGFCYLEDCYLDPACNWIWIKNILYYFF